MGDHELVHSVWSALILRTWRCLTSFAPSSPETSPSDRTYPGKINDFVKKFHIYTIFFFERSRIIIWHTPYSVSAWECPVLCRYRNTHCERRGDSMRLPLTSPGNSLLCTLFHLVWQSAAWYNERPQNCKNFHLPLCFTVGGTIILLGLVVLTPTPWCLGPNPQTAILVWLFTQPRKITGFSLGCLGAQNVSGIPRMGIGFLIQDGTRNIWLTTPYRTVNSCRSLWEAKVI